MLIWLWPIPQVFFMPCSDVSEIRQGQGWDPERAVLAHGASGFPPPP